LKPPKLLFGTSPLWKLLSGFFFFSSRVSEAGRERKFPGYGEARRRLGEEGGWKGWGGRQALTFLFTHQFLAVAIIFFEPKPVNYYFTYFFFGSFSNPGF
jgi:hypothetical protein